MVFASVTEPMPASRVVAADKTTQNRRIQMLKSGLMILAAMTALAATSGGANAQSFGHQGQCEDYARRVAYRQGDANNVVGGALAGAALGGVFGAITGNGHASNIGTGLAVGAATGGVLGAASGNGRYDRQAYDRAYWRCMRNASYQTYQMSPPHAYGRAVAYCSARYRSYNPATGLFLSTSGAYRQCP